LTLQHALSRERQLHELKSNFVASVSHELRAPVASMRVMAENLGSGIVPGEARQKEYHRLIAEECGRLSTLIENVLDLARIEQDRKTYRFLETDVRAMIDDAVSLITPSAARRGQRFEVRVAAIDLPPHCDGLAIQRALINLLDNASKFSPPDSAIEVRTEMSGPTHWTLSVADRGPGIAPEERERIFERFYRIGSELRRETPGAGIGLSVVRHIVEGHGGKAFVEPAPDGGSIFNLRLPLQPPTT
jgi:signal transduction histidine kinase